MKSTRRRILGTGETGRVTIQFPKAILDALREKSIRDGKSVSLLISEAIEKLLQEEKENGESLSGK